MTSASVTYSVHEVRPDYFTYLVLLHPADSLLAIRQASGACRTDAEAEARVATALDLIARRLERMSAAPIPARRVGPGPQRRALRRCRYALGFMLACALSVGLVGGILGALISLALGIR